MVESSQPKNPVLAALPSFFISGLGQTYSGHVKWGLVIRDVQFISRPRQGCAQRCNRIAYGGEQTDGRANLDCCCRTAREKPGCQRVADDNAGDQAGGGEGSRALVWERKLPLSLCRGTTEQRLFSDSRMTEGDRTNELHSPGPQQG